MAVEELLKKLLESGVHFGHQTQRWNPKMRPFIFGQRCGIYIIDLEKTVEELTKARDFLRDISIKGGHVLFVGTKKQAQSIVKDEALRSDMFYINNRWLGGLLTNYQTVRKSINRLNHMDKMQEDGTWDSLSKKEISRLNKEKNRLINDFGGIREMGDLPSAIFIVDPKREDIAVREARKLSIPIVAIVDTNCDPDFIDYPIPGNDDAIKSVSFITNYINQAILEGRKAYVDAGLVVKSSEKSTKDESKKTTKASEAKPAATEQKEVNSDAPKEENKASA